MGAWTGRPAGTLMNIGCVTWFILAQQDFNLKTMGKSMTARDEEAALLADCVQAAKGLHIAHSQQQAHVYRLAAMVVQSRHPAAASALMQAGNSYFANHPGQLLASREVVARGWVSSLPRLRDMLNVQLSA